MKQYTQQQGAVEGDKIYVENGGGREIERNADRQREREGGIKKNLKLHSQHYTRCSAGGITACIDPSEIKSRAFLPVDSLFCTERRSGTTCAFRVEN